MFYIAAPHIVNLARLLRTVEDAGPYGYGGIIAFCVSFLDTQAVSQETIKHFKPHNTSAAVKTTGETGGLHSPYKGQLQAEPLKGAQKV